MLAAAGIMGVHPFDVDKMPEDIQQHQIEMDTGLTARQRAVNWFYEREDHKVKNRGPPMPPRVLDYRTGKYVVAPNWDIRKACNPSRCEIKGLACRRLPKADFTAVINFLLKSHDTLRVPATDDGKLQAVHLTRRACTEMVIYVEALNECMLATANLVAGLPEENWLIPVLVRWDTIQAFIEDSLNALMSASRMADGKLVCRSGKRFKKMLEDRQDSLPLPATFAKVDSSKFVPGRDFRFMSPGMGTLKKKQKVKTLDPKIELQGNPKAQDNDKTTRDPQ